MYNDKYRVETHNPKKEKMQAIIKSDLWEAVKIAEGFKKIK